jgi:hypothetical protein
LLILGQETFGSYNPVGKSKLGDAYTAAIGAFIAFDYAEGGEPRQHCTPFWQGFRESCGHAGVPAPHGAAWSNLVKVQVVGRSETSVLSLSADDQHKMLEWTYELFHAELRFVAPKRILCFTGPNYDWILQRMLSDLQFHSVEGFTRNELVVGKSPSFGFTIARTYHPQYLVRSKKWHLIKEAVAHL